jgi:uncharacterized membrane protein HdeD (DUF308 family)
MNTSPAPLIWKGILAVIVGVVAVVWPGITVGAFVILFAFYAFIAAGMEAVAAFRSRSAGPVIGRLLLAGLDVAAGIVALVWPGITAYALVVVVAAWALISGFGEVILAFGAGETAGERSLLALVGLVSIALGVVFAIRPDIGAVTLAQVYGLFSIVSGISTLVMIANLRHPERLRYVPDPARV